jgi:Ca-activated chloride channel homolog
MSDLLPQNIKPHKRIRPMLGKISKEEFMNAKIISLFGIVLGIYLSGCASAAPTAAPAAPIAASQKDYGALPSAPVAPAAATAAPAVAVGGLSPAPTSASLANPPAGSRHGVPTPIDNFFEGSGINPFVDSSEDHLSTFALDVDTASYTMARKYIRDGSLPPPDAVRVEEFVNFFRQDYPLPSNAAFGIYADGAPSPFHHDGSYLLRIGIQGYSVSEWERKPMALTFVIDTSGSMAEQNRLELVKQSLRLLVNRLRADDLLAIVAFTTDARTVLPPTPGSSKNTILEAIQSLHPQATTNVNAGLQLGYQWAWNMYRAERTNRVILCSDGVANVSATDPNAILDFVHGYTEHGITLTSIGVGMGNYNDSLLEQLADKGDGNYYYVDTMEEAQRVLVDNLTGTLQIIAQDAKVQVDFNPEVVARYRLIGYENRAVADSDFRNNSVDAGAIGAGHTATAIYAVQLKQPAQGRIATVQLRWQDPDTRQVKEINGNFNTWDLASSFENASARYQLAVTVAEYAELLRHSPYAGGASLRSLSEYASRFTEQLSEDSDVRDFIDLVTQAGRLSYR